MRKPSSPSCNLICNQIILTIINCHHRHYCNHQNIIMFYKQAEDRCGSLLALAAMSFSMITLIFILASSIRLGEQYKQYTGYYLAIIDAIFHFWPAEYLYILLLLSASASVLLSLIAALLWWARYSSLDDVHGEKSYMEDHAWYCFDRRSCLVLFWFCSFF